MTPCVIFFPRACVPIKAEFLPALPIITIYIYHTDAFAKLVHFATIIRIPGWRERTIFNIIFFLINEFIITAGSSSVLVYIKLAPTTTNAERYDK
mgnify:CR=1 FL=1